MDILKNGLMELKEITSKGNYTLLEQINSSHPKFVVAYRMRKEENKCSWICGNYIESLSGNRDQVYTNAILFFDSKL